MGKYDSKKHEESIRERHRHEEASADAFAGAADASRENEEQVRRRLDEIADGLQGLHEEIGSLRSSSDTPLRPGSMEAAIADGLRKLAGVRRSRARAHARPAAEKIRDFMRDNDSRASESEITDAIRGIDGKDIDDASSYADAVHHAVSNAVLEPGRNLPHDMRALDELHRILTAAGDDTSEGRDGKDGRDGRDGRSKHQLASPPPAIASSEIIRDVSHLNTLLLGSSPAFAEAMRVQSDAIAYSIAALNKVGDMQRQDALGLAITAHAAVTQMDRR